MWFSVVTLQRKGIWVICYAKYIDSHVDGQS